MTADPRGMPDPMLRYLRDAADRLSTALPDGHSAAWDDTPLTAHRVGVFMEVPNEVLMDMGIIPDTRPPVRISRRTRLRWWWSAWRERVGRKVGGWIAGVDLSERDDW